MRPSDRLSALRDRVLALADEHWAWHVRVFGSVAERTERELHPLLRDRILAQAQPL